MMKLKRLCALAISLCLLVQLSPVILAASPTDWPQWRGPHRDGLIPSLTVPQKWPQNLEKVWQTKVGAGDASPALIDSRIYLHTRQGDEEVILCLDAETGKEIWANKYPSPPVTGPAARHPGPRSSPAVADGKVVTLGATGIASCVDAADGRTVWRNDSFKGTPQFFTSMSPVVLEKAAIFHLGGPKQGVVVAFDMSTGAIRWQWEGDAPSYSSPVVATVEGVRQIVLLSEQNLLGLAVKDGKVLWQVPFPAGGRSYNAATPIVDGAVVYFAAAGRGSHAIRIQKQGEQFVTKELWSNPDLAPQFNSPVLLEGKLFGLSQQGQLYCLDAATGKTLWRDENRFSQFGATVAASSIVLAMTEQAGLIVFPASEKGFNPLAKYEVSTDPIYATPVVAGDRIYIKDAETLTLWRIK